MPKYQFVDFEADLKYIPTTASAYIIRVLQCKPLSTTYASTAGLLSSCTPWAKAHFTAGKRHNVVRQHVPPKRGAVRKRQWVCVWMPHIINCEMQSATAERGALARSNVLQVSRKAVLRLTLYFSQQWLGLRVHAYIEPLPYGLSVKCCRSLVPNPTTLLRVAMTASNTATVYHTRTTVRSTNIFYMCSSTPRDHNTHVMYFTHHRTGMLHLASAGTSQSLSHERGRSKQNQGGNEAIVSLYSEVEKERRGSLHIVCCYVDGSKFFFRRGPSQVRWNPGVAANITVGRDEVKRNIYIFASARISAVYHLDPYHVPGTRHSNLLP